MAQKHTCIAIGVFFVCLLDVCYTCDINTNMSTNPFEWEKILKHGVCSDCGSNLDFDNCCEDCTGTSDYVDNVLGT